MLLLLFIATFSDSVFVFFIFLLVYVLLYICFALCLTCFALFVLFLYCFWVIWQQRLMPSPQLHSHMQTSPHTQSYTTLFFLSFPPRTSVVPVAPRLSRTRPPMFVCFCCLFEFGWLIDLLCLGGFVLFCFLFAYLIDFLLAYLFLLVYLFAGSIARVHARVTFSPSLDCCVCFDLFCPTRLFCSILVFVLRFVCACVWF